MLAGSARIGFQGMTMTTAYTKSESFTVINARKLAAKVAADMHQCQRFYGWPSAKEVEEFNGELIVLLAGHYVSQYEFGFKTEDDRRVVSWRYRVTTAGDLEGGRAGGLVPSADIRGAVNFNFLWTTTSWADLTQSERAAIEAHHNVHRTISEPPVDGNGRWVRDRTYVSGGVAMEREEFRPW